MPTQIEEDQSDIHQPEPRPKAAHEANLLHSAFFGRPLPSSHAADADASNRGNASSRKRKSSSSRPKNERPCMGGHRETIFGMSFSSDGKYVATASQDSSICIWDVNSHRLAAKLTDGIDAEHECLRVSWMDTRDENDDDRRASAADSGGARGKVKYVLASSGADGVVRLWSGRTDGGEEKLTWRSAGALDHASLEKNGVDDNDDHDAGNASKEEEEPPQIYALQFVRSGATSPDNLNAQLLTSADDRIYLWNVVVDGGGPRSPDAGDDDDDGAPEECKISLLPRLSIRYDHVDDDTYQFGGERNPNNRLYVFDASHCERNDLLGVALSDGTCRVSYLADAEEEQGESHHLLRDYRRCALSLPPGYFGGKSGHLTALSWDRSGTRLATSIASGRVVLWLLQVVDRGGVLGLHPSCISILEGGHDPGRPLFGAKYFGGENQELLLTWGVDGKVCVWDSYSVGEVWSPMCTVVSHKDYPIYALDVTEDGIDSKAQAKGEQKARIGLGGGADGGFLGVPAYLYDV